MFKRKNIIHNFSKNGWGNALLNSGASWSHEGAVRTGDFIQIDNSFYKVLEAKPCGDPKDMSFIKKYMSIGDIELGEKVDGSTLEDEYQKIKSKHTIYEFPLK